MYRIIVLVSGAGSNFASIVTAIEKEKLQNVEIVSVIADNPNAKALLFAKEKEIPTTVISRKDPNLSNQILEIAQSTAANLIVLAGFLSILEGKLLDEYQNQIINIHPSLIPSFCGDGMYGIHVHEAAIEYGVKVSGCTVHFVSEETDGGPILLQKVVNVTTTDPKELQQQILQKEHEAIVEAVGYLSENRVQIKERQVTILPKI